MNTYRFEELAGDAGLPFETPPEAVFLVGSTVSGREIDPADHDLVCLCDDVHLGEEVQFTTTSAHGVEASWSCYNPSHFFSICSSPQLTSLWYREVKKIAYGMLLRDSSGIGRDLQTVAGRTFYPRADLSALCHEVLKELGNHGAQVLDWSLESIIFARLNLSSTWYYTKPKWVVSDLAKSGAQQLLDLVMEVSGVLEQECTRNHVWDSLPLLKTTLADVTPQRTRPLFQIHFRDAGTMLRKVSAAHAVWPLRMGLFQALTWVRNNLDATIPYSDIRDLWRIDKNYVVNGVAIGEAVAHVSTVSAARAQDWVERITHEALGVIEACKAEAAAS